MEWMFVKMLLSLGAVLLLMFGIVYALRRYAVAGGAAAHQPVSIEILGRKALQPKKSVVVMKVAGKVLVVGITEHGMNLLTELTEEETVKTTAPATTVHQPRRKSGFAAQLQATLSTVVNRALEKSR